jgi:hypothetical protein
MTSASWEGSQGMQHTCSIRSALSHCNGSSDGSSTARTIRGYQEVSCRQLRDVAGIRGKTRNRHDNLLIIVAHFHGHLPWPFALSLRAAHRAAECQADIFHSTQARSRLGDVGVLL